MFTTKEMIDAFDACGQKKPSQMPVAIFDAKRYKQSVEKKGHDQWAITNAGENLILELIEDRPN